MMRLIATTMARQAQRNLDQAQTGGERSTDLRSHSHQEIVREAIDLMETNLEVPISVAEVARTLGFSLPYFSTLFTASTGRNPSDYLIELRIEQAKTYLSHTSMSIREVCSALGYRRSYFSRLFKQRTGYSPEEFARNTRPNGANGSRSSHL
jgi:transcriptional regulator GlxA family with amidase domain